MVFVTPDNTDTNEKNNKRLEIAKTLLDDVRCECCKHVFYIIYRLKNEVYNLQPLPVFVQCIDRESLDNKSAFTQTLEIFSEDVFELIGDGYGFSSSKQVTDQIIKDVYRLTKTNEIYELDEKFRPNLMWGLTAAFLTSHNEDVMVNFDEGVVFIDRDLSDWENDK